MSQVSPPLRIALIAAVAFLGVWALFLRPEPVPPVSEEPASVAPAAPAATSSDPSAAAAAAANANASVAAADAKAGALTGTTAPAGSPAAVVPPAGTSAAAVAPQGAAGAREIPLNREALAKLPADVAAAVRRDKVIALLFWNSRAPEDRRVRRALRDANSHGGRVFVRVAPVSDIARYAPITRGVDVAQSPTLVVVDADLHAEALVGYVARTTIRQALSDAIRAGS